MYRYDEFDHAFVRERVGQFRDQVERRLSGDLDEEQFKPLRLQNGVYLQLHAYMLRIAVPYGTLSPRQMRQLATIARTYDKGYGHFTTRQNLQFNWPRLEDVPDILEKLAGGRRCMPSRPPAIASATSRPTTSPASRPTRSPIRDLTPRSCGNGRRCTRNSFSCQEVQDRGDGRAGDRAAIQFHDIGYEVKRNEGGELGFAVFIGGGMGRTPMLGKKIRDFLPEEDLLAYSEAILRVYNMHGPPRNKFKARIKILSMRAASKHRRGIERSSRPSATACACRRRGPPHRAYFAPPPTRPAQAPCWSGRVWAIRLSPLGAPQCDPPPRAGYAS
jgi:sulfite reductase (NADPH) hemoprotein beta-component